MAEVYVYFSLVHVIWFAVGGGFGAALRYVISQAVQPAPGTWPVATLLVNLTGAGLLGFIAAFFNDFAYSPGFLFWELGVIGGYTTLATFSVETMQLLHERRFSAATGYVLASFSGSIVLLMLGFQLGGLVS